MCKPFLKQSFDGWIWIFMPGLHADYVIVFISNAMHSKKKKQIVLLVAVCWFTSISPVHEIITLFTAWCCGLWWKTCFYTVSVFSQTSCFLIMPPAYMHLYLEIKKQEQRSFPTIYDKCTWSRSHRGYFHVFLSTCFIVYSKVSTAISIFYEFSSGLVQFIHFFFPL